MVKTTLTLSTSLALPNSSLFLHSSILLYPSRDPGGLQVRRDTPAARGPDDITGLASALTGCLIQSSHLEESEHRESQSTLLNLAPPPRTEHAARFNTVQHCTEKQQKMRFNGTQETGTAGLKRAGLIQLMTAAFHKKLLFPITSPAC